MECGANISGNTAAAIFSTFYYMFTCEFLRHCDVNDVIYDAVGARANMSVRERDVMGLASPTVSARVTKHFATIFSKTCYNV